MDGDPLLRPGGSLTGGDTRSAKGAWLPGGEPGRQRRGGEGQQNRDDTRRRVGLVMLRTIFPLLGGSSKFGTVPAGVLRDSFRALNSCDLAPLLLSLKPERAKFFSLISSSGNSSQSSTTSLFRRKPSSVRKAGA